MPHWRQLVRTKKRTLFFNNDSYDTYMDLPSQITRSDRVSFFRILDVHITLYYEFIAGPGDKHLRRYSYYFTTVSCLRKCKHKLSLEILLFCLEY